MSHQLHPSDRLAAEDAVFLYLETEQSPLHIGSVSIFDGPIPYEECVAFVESKLPLIPRYRQRIVTPPFNFGHPTWEPDPTFDIRKHIGRETLRAGSLTSLEALSGEIFGQVMDRCKPLWDMVIVDGLRGGRSALISRVHHCLVDGVSGVGLLNVILGAAPGSEQPPKTHPFHPPPIPDQATSLVDAILSSYSEMVDRVLSTQSAVLNIAQTLVSNSALTGLDQLIRLVPELLTPVERLPFNKSCLGPRKVAWTEISMGEVADVRAVLNGTLNDVMLSVVATAVRRHALHHGQPLEHKLLRLMVPVNVRGGTPDTSLGNRVSMLPVSIPLDIGDPIELLAAVHQRTAALKAARVADLIHLMATWMGTTPAPLQALLGPLTSLLPVPPFNMVCTNVPGPQFPLYLLGRKMLTYYPYVPIGNEMGLGCAIQSYDGKLYIGLTADAAAAPDVSRIRKFLSEAFDELRQAAGVGKKRPRKRKATRTIEAEDSTGALENENVEQPSGILASVTSTIEHAGAATSNP